MNFKGFKKINTDKKSTTLIHEDGHELKIAHGVLSKKMRADLDKLPHYDKPKKMAKGGEADPGYAVESSEDEDKPWLTANADAANQLSSVPFIGDIAKREAAYYNKQSQAQAAPEAAPAADAAVPSPANNAPAPASVAPPAAPEPQADAAPPAQTLAPEAAPPAAPDQASEADQTAAPAPEATPDLTGQQAPQNENQANYQKGFGDYQQENAQKMGYDAAAWQHDLANGHVRPETYHELFAKQDTLGKVGTLFGLLVAGIGSGLTHQPNAVLGMMDNEIKNDMDAQQKSKGNAVEYTKLGLMQQKQDAEIKNMVKTGQLTDAEAAQKRQELKVSQYAMSNVMKNQTAYQAQVNMVKNMSPNDPRYPAALKALAWMQEGADRTNSSILNIAASKQAMIQAYGGGGEGGTMGLRMNGQDRLADAIDSRTIPGVKGLAQRAVPEEKRNEFQAMQTLDYKVNDLLNFAKAHKGTLSPSDRAIGAQKSEELVNYYNASLGSGALTQGRLKWLDEQIKKNPTSIFQDVLGNNSRLTEIRDSNAQRRNIMLKGLGPLSVSGEEQQPSGGGKNAQASQAIAWARAHSKDPRAAKILKLNGIK